MSYKIKQRLQMREEVLQQWGAKKVSHNVVRQLAKSGDRHETHRGLRDYAVRRPNERLINHLL